MGDHRALLWSDIPNNRILRWDEETGAVSAYRKPSNYSNGNTRDRQGRLVTCEHGGRRVTRTEYDGSVRVLVDGFNGKRLNSPNDLVVKSDGSIWFTDPLFGILGDYEGYKAEPELAMNVYRHDPAAGKTTVVAEGVLGPNGLAFSPDEKILYIVESRGVPNRKILAYDVGADGATLAKKRIHIDAGAGTPDGFRVDVDGNLWCGWGMGTRGARWRAHLQCRRQTDRTHRIARALREFVLWRTRSQSAVHGSEPVRLCTLCQHAGGSGWLRGM